jgi:hypothetical protein
MNTRLPSRMTGLRPTVSETDITAHAISCLLLPFSTPHVVQSLMSRWFQNKCVTGGGGGQSPRVIKINTLNKKSNFLRLISFKLLRQITRNSINNCKFCF